MKSVASKIRNIRTSKGYSQEYMAERLGISQRQYGRLENGETELNLHYLDQISKELELKLEDLFSSEVSQENNHQSGGLANSAQIIVNEFSDKLIEQYEKRIEEKDQNITMLREMLSEKDKLIQSLFNK